MKAYKPVRGMRDFTPEDAMMMRYVEDKAREAARLYGFREVITPVVESYELLAAKAGEEVRKRMYTFKDLGGRKVALRPEFTASVARLVATTMRNEPKPLRLFSIGSLYRYDEPQKGRFREFWQSNFELIGSERPEADAEIMLLTDTLMRSVGLRNYTFKIGHVGVLRGLLGCEGLLEEVQNHVMQLMDKKQYEESINLVKDAGASERCLSAFEGLIKLKGKSLNEIFNEMRRLVKDYDAALNAVENLAQIVNLTLESLKCLDLTVEAGFARGLEYYTGVIFEVYVPELEIALAGGGRYNRLVEAFGGEPTPAVGVAHGIDRIMLAMKEQKVQMKVRHKEPVIVIPVSQSLSLEVLKISEMLRENGVPAEVEVMGRRVTKALEDANRREVRHVIIVGEKELKDNSVILRDMRLKHQQVVKIEKLLEHLKV
ncbi:MAG: histidine--tRNA ligase [Candidatus Bathyarchaeia archaeon]